MMTKKRVMALALFTLLLVFAIGATVSACDHDYQEYNSTVEPVFRGTDKEPVIDSEGNVIAYDIYNIYDVYRATWYKCSNCNHHLVNFDFLYIKTVHVGRII